VSERVEARGSVQLGWPRGRPRRPDKVIERAIEAIEALRPALRPTLFQINLRLRGSDELPGRWLWSLEERGFEDVEEGAVEEDGEVVFRVVDRVDRDAMQALAREALAAGDGVDISSISVEVRSARPAARPIEMEVWALTDLSIDMDWPLGDGGESPAEVERAVARLVALGWQVDDEPVDPVLVAEEEEEEALTRTERPVALQLYWTGARPADPLAAAMLAVDAVAAFARIAAPASASIEVAFVDIARVRPDRHRFALQASRIDLAGIRGLAREALEPQRPAGLAGRLRGSRAVEWTQIAVGLRDGGGAPASPLQLVFTQRPAVHLEVQLRSAGFADPSAAGRDRVERAVATLARAGWKRAPDRP
jgi:hypothetical protein